MVKLADTLQALKPQMKVKYLFFLLPILLLVFQFTLTKNSLFQIRYEELGESIRNVYWLANGRVYDSISTDVGWFVQLLVVYKIFGFSLFAAKWYRLGLAFLSTMSVACLALKYIGPRLGWMPLVAFGLSPTFLYFNTVQSEYGLDLLYLPILLLILDKIDFKKNKFSYILTSLLFSLLMLNWTGYPAFMFFIPGIFLLFLKKTARAKDFLKQIITAVAGFITPLILILVYVKNRNLLIYDPVLQGGLFRGGGKLQIGPVFENLKAFSLDFIGSGHSYYFELNKSDFSDIYPVLSILAVAILTYLLWFKYKKIRIIFLSVFSIIAINFLISALTLDVSPPGMRRFTGVLASFYFLYGIVCFALSKEKIKNVSAKWLIIIILALIPLHHLLVYQQNLTKIKQPSAWGTQSWFLMFGKPSESVETLTSKAQSQDLQLSCQDQKNEFIKGCRYSEIYAVISSYCLFNKLNCHQILGFDPKSKSFIPLTTQIWENDLSPDFKPI